MTELPFAYLSAALLIVGLLVIARRNRAQGWRRQRGAWLDVKVDAVTTVFHTTKTASAPEVPLQHLGDLSRLQRSLTTHGAPQSPAPVEKEVLTRGR